MKTIQEYREALDTVLYRTQYTYDWHTAVCDVRTALDELAHLREHASYLARECNNAWEHVRVLREALQAVRNTDDHADGEVRATVRSALAATAPKEGTT